VTKRKPKPKMPKVTKYQALKAVGLCVECGRKPSERTDKCERCRERFNARRRKKKLPSVLNGANAR